MIDIFFSPGILPAFVAENRARCFRAFKCVLWGQIMVIQTGDSKNLMKW